MGTDSAVDELPPPPAGFRLDSAATDSPPPPPGFTLDAAAPVDTAPPSPPPGFRLDASPATGKPGVGYFNYNPTSGQNEPYGVARTPWKAEDLEAIYGPPTADSPLPESAPGKGDGVYFLRSAAPTKATASGFEVKDLPGVKADTPIDKATYDAAVERRKAFEQQRGAQQWAKQSPTVRAKAAIDAVATSPAFAAMTPDQKQAMLLRTARLYAPELQGSDADLTNLLGTDYAKGSLATGAGQGLSSFVQFSNDIAETAGLGGSKFEPNINPDRPAAGTVGRAVGGALPIAALSIAAPEAVPYVLGAQGLGGGLREGRELGYSPNQTAAVALERGAFNMLIGRFIPGGAAGAAGKSALLSGAKTVLELQAMNIGQAAMESKVKQYVGIEDEGAWEAVVKAAASGDGWAQSILFGGIHAVTAQMAKPKAPEETGKTSDAMYPYAKADEPQNSVESAPKAPLAHTGEIPPPPEGFKLDNQTPAPAVGASQASPGGATDSTATAETAKEPWEMTQAEHAKQTEGETVKSAATKFSSGEVHEGAIHPMINTPKGQTVVEEGFTTSKGRFVSRAEGAMISGGNYWRDVVDGNQEGSSEGVMAKPDDENPRRPMQASDFHRWSVEKAIRDGKPVPSDVLAEYPDLSKGATDAEETRPRVGQPSPKGALLQEPRPAQARAGEGGGDTARPEPAPARQQENKVPGLPQADDAGVKAADAVLATARKYDPDAAPIEHPADAKAAIAAFEAHTGKKVISIQSKKIGGMVDPAHPDHILISHENPRQSWQEVLAHEWGHSLFTDHPELAKAVTDALSPADRARLIAERTKLAQQGRTPEEAAAYMKQHGETELVAMALQDAARKGPVFKALQGLEPSILERILAVPKKLWDGLRGKNAHVDAAIDAIRKAIPAPETQGGKLNQGVRIGSTVTDGHISGKVTGGGGSDKSKFVAVTDDAGKLHILPAESVTSVEKTPTVVPSDTANEQASKFTNTKEAIKKAMEDLGKPGNITLGSGFGNLSTALEHATKIAVSVVKDLALIGKHGFDHFVKAVSDNIADARLRRLMIDGMRDPKTGKMIGGARALYNAAREHPDITTHGIQHAMTPDADLPGKDCGDGEALARSAGGA